MSFNALRLKEPETDPGEKQKNPNYASIFRNKDGFAEKDKHQQETTQQALISATRTTLIRIALAKLTEPRRDTHDRDGFCQSTTIYQSNHN